MGALAHVLARAIGLHASDAVVVPAGEVARTAAELPAPAPWAPNAVGRGIRGRAVFTRRCVRHPMVTVACAGEEGEGVRNGCGRWRR